MDRAGHVALWQDRRVWLAGSMAGCDGVYGTATPSEHAIRTRRCLARGVVGESAGACDGALTFVSSAEHWRTVWLLVGRTVCQLDALGQRGARMDYRARMSVPAQYWVVPWATDVAEPRTVCV